jgi:uncharacterized membrane protein
MAKFVGRVSIGSNSIPSRLGRWVLSADVTVVIAAVVGVVGTLSSPVLTQRLTQRAKQQELDFQRRQWLDEREEERLRTNLRERRDTYIAVNASARALRRALKNSLFDSSADVNAELEQARAVFGTCYAECQLIATDTVLEVAGSVSGELAAAYGAVKKLVASNQESVIFDSERQELHDLLDGSVRDEIQRLRLVMRVDLGITR